MGEHADDVNKLRIRLVVPAADLEAPNVTPSELQKLDVHLSVGRDAASGARTVTVGSKVNGRWADVTLSRQSEWWNRLHYVPERYKPNAGAVSEEPSPSNKASRSIQDELNNIRYLKMLARRPARTTPSDLGSPTFQPEINKRSKRLASGSAWWDRLSLPPWVQAEELRMRFHAENGPASQDEQDDALLAMLEQLGVGEEPLHTVSEAKEEEQPVPELAYEEFELDLSEQRHSTAREEKPGNEEIEVSESDAEEIEVAVLKPEAAEIVAEPSEPQEQNETDADAASAEELQEVAGGTEGPADGQDQPQAEEKQEEETLNEPNVE